MTDSDIQRDLSKLFAYKAEWLKEKIFDLFMAPGYFTSLSTDVPCVLVGGRGTGKTTVLKGLAYTGQYALSDKQPSTIRSWSTYGFYIRVDTNRMAAFRGPEVTDQRWQKLFAHYINLLLCDLAMEFMEWYEVKTDTQVDVTTRQWNRIATSLSIEPGDSLTDIRSNIMDAIVQFESYLNNIGDEPPIAISMQGAPIDLLFSTLQSTEEFSGKQFSFLIDEYENLSDSQQQVVNTLIKHASSHYTYTIGVRELGWRCKTTLNHHEQLVSPADYRLIKITDELLSNNGFPAFAESVCNARLRALTEKHPEVPESIVDLFPGLTLEEEALKLGVRVAASKIRAAIGEISEEEMTFFESLSPLEQYFLQFKATSDRESLEHVVSTACQDDSWKSKFDNYSYALLFTLKRKKRGIRKFYCGWRVLCHLADGNLRYLIELIDASISRHLTDGHTFSTQISPETQTLAAHAVGKKNLNELEGLSVHGAKLTKLLLGLGRVFGIMASEAEGHTPEVNQFDISDGELSEDVDELLRAGIMHLALVRFTGTKPVGMDTKDYDYSIHPVYAPFFNFSHRKKRKMKVTGDDLLGLISNPPRAIEKLLANSNRQQTDSLPDQLTLFETYFDGRS